MYMTVYICSVFSSLLNYCWSKDEIHIFWEYSPHCWG